MDTTATEALAITTRPIDRFFAADGSDHPNEEEALRQNLLLAMRGINDTKERIEIAWALANPRKREVVFEAMRRCGLLPSAVAA